MRLQRDPLGRWCACLWPGGDWYQEPTSQLKTIIVMIFMCKFDARWYPLGARHDCFAKAHNRLTVGDALELCSNGRLRESLINVQSYAFRERETHAWSIIIARGNVTLIVREYRTCRKHMADRISLCVNFLSQLCVNMRFAVSYT